MRTVRRYVGGSEWAGGKGRDVGNAYNGDRLDDAAGRRVDLIDRVVPIVDEKKVRKSVDDLSSFAASLGDKDGPTQKTLADAAALMKHLNQTAAKLDAALADLDGVAKAFDAKKVATLMDGAAAVGQTLKDNNGNLDRTLKDAADIAAKLDKSADKIDGLMTSAQSFLGAPGTKGAMSQIGDAARSIRELADQMNLRVRQMSTGLVKFSGSGLREYEGMAVDARKTLNDLDRVILSIENHPSQLIFGKK